MKKICCIYIHGVNPSIQKPIARGYSKIFHEVATNEINKGRDLPLRFRHFEINWSKSTLKFKNQLAKLQFDMSPKRPGKFFIRKTVRGFIYPAVVDILYYVKNKGAQNNTGPMIIMEKLHKTISDIKGSGCNNIIIFAHSLGSVVAYDYIFRFSKLFPFPKGVHLKALVTFGSPIALFASAMGYPISTKIKRPAYIDKWLNFWDYDDGIATRMIPHFPKKFSRNFLEDYEVNTHWLNPLKAHQNYWTKKKVIRQIGREIKEVL